MRHRSLLILTAVLTTGALTLTACGSRDDSKSSGGDGGNQTVVIGLDAPLTGDLSALGLGIKNSADLAVKTANKEKTVPGVTFKLEALDDQAQPSVGQQNAVKLIGTKEVLGVVGPLNSGVAQSMQKPLNDAKLTQVSPANTGTELTQGNNWKTGDKKRPFASYFRTATTDQIQGAFAAKYLFETAKIKDVYLIDDQKPYGAGLAASFKATFTELGGKIVGTDHVNPEDRDFNSVATKVKSSKAKAVYYGGEYPAGAPLSQQIKDSVKIPFMGGDGMYSADFISSTRRPKATSPPPSASPSRSWSPPRSSSRTTRRPATRTPTRLTAAAPTTPPGPSSRPSRSSPPRTTARSPRTTPAPRSSRPWTRSSSRASPAPSPSTSSATPPTP